MKNKRYANSKLQKVKYIKMQKAEYIRSGKAKDIYRRPDGDLVFVFTDRVTAFDGEKKAEYAGKGAVCCKLSCFWFELLEAAGVKTHFKEFVPPNELVAEEVELLPVEVIARNFLYGSLWRRCKSGELEVGSEFIAQGAGKKGKKEGLPLTKSFVEFTTKFEPVDRPVREAEILARGWLDEKEVEVVKRETRRVGEIMQSYLAQRGILLADFKLEYGRRRSTSSKSASSGRGEIILADEVGTPDVCRFWEKEAYESRREIISLDKDVFRQGKGDLLEVYLEVCERILG